MQKLVSACYFIFIFAGVLSAQGHVYTGFPKDDGTYSLETIDFSWYPHQNNIDYTMEISTDSLFGSIHFQTTTTDTFVSTGGFEHYETYFWKVTANNISDTVSVYAPARFTSFFPDSLPGVKLWLSADSVQKDGSDLVDTWYDRSTFGYNAIQSNAANKPLFLDDVINCLPALHFSGNQYMLISDNAFLLHNHTAFIVARSDINGANKCIMGRNYNAPGAYIRIITALEYFVNGITVTSGSMFINNNKFFLSGMKYNSVNQDLFLAPSSSSSAPNASGIINYHISDASLIGAVGNTTGSFTWGYYGDMAEILISDSVLADTMYNKVISYLRYKYAPPVDLGPDITVDFGFCDTTINAGNAYTNYFWNTGNPEDTLSSLVVSESGVYHVTVTDIFGFQSSDSISVNFPSPQLISDTSICMGDTLVWNTGMNNSYSFLWSDLSTDSLIVISDANDYFVQISDGSCIYQSDTISVSIDSFSVNVSLGPDTAICAGNYIGLVSGGSEAILYSWSSFDSSPTIQVQSQGYYSVTVTDINQCSAIDSVYITISGSAPIPNFSFGAACNNSNVALNDLSYTLDNSNIIAWQWNIDSIGSSTNQNPVFLFPDTGNYMASFSILTDSGCYGDTSFIIHIDAKPIAGFLMSPLSCINIPTIMEDMSLPPINGSISSWLWNFGDSSSASDQNTSHIFSSTGIYYITLTVTASNGCSDSIIQSTNVQTSYDAPLPFTLYTPSNGSVILEDSSLFAWNPSLNAQRYIFRIASDPQFMNILFEDTTSNLSINAPHILQQNYYWNVTALNPCNISYLSATYTFTVFHPDTINGIKLWLSADNVIKNGSDLVESWNDLSGMGNNAIQNNATNKPVFINNTINNLPVIRFNGSQFLVIPDSAFFLGNHTVFIVARSESNSVNKCLLGRNYNSSGAFLRIVDKMEYSINGVAMTTNPDNYNNNKFLLTGLEFDSPNQSIYIAPNFYYSATNTTGSIVYHADDASTIGAVSNTSGSYAWAFSGDMAEIIISDSILTASEYDLVIKYLRDKYAPPVNLGPDIYVNNGFCDTIISAGNSFTQYTWNTGNPGDILPTLSVSETGTYAVTVTDVFGFQSVDSVNVFFPAPATFSDTTICLGDSICWNTGFNHDYVFTWQDFSSDSLIYINEAGDYHVQIFDGVCTYISDTFTVVIDSFSVIATLGPDTDLCSGNNITVMNAQASVFNWSTGATTPVIVIDTAGLYWVTASNARGCQMTDSITVTGIHGDAPTVIFNIDHFCLHDTALFTDMSYTSDGSNITGWDWDFGDSFSSSQQNPWHYYTASGQFIVSLTVETDSNCSNILLDTMNVRALPQAGFYTSLACHNIPVSFIDTSISADGSLSIWEWNFDDSNTSFAQNPSHIFSNEGLYNITFISVTEYGCSDTTTVPILIKESPDAGFIFSSACIGNPTYFENTSQYNTLWPPDSWSWDFGDMIDSDDKNPSHIYSTTGTHSVTMIVHTLNGCIDTVSKDVYVNPRPSADFSDLPGCEGWYYNFAESSTIVSGNITNWSWFVDNIIISAQQNPVYTFYSPGTYIVQLVVTSDSTCKDTLTRQLVINELPDAGFTINPGYGTPTTAISMLNESGSDSYLWDFGDGSTFSGQNPVIYYADSGTYYIELIVSNSNGCSDTSGNNIMIIYAACDLAITNVNRIIEGNTMSVNAEMINLSNIPMTSLNMYLSLNNNPGIMEIWEGGLDPGQILNYTFIANFIVDPDDLPDLVCVKADLNDCTDMNPGNNELCLQSDNVFTVYDPYPNPFSEDLTIEVYIPEANPLIIDMFDADGRIVFSKLFTQTIKGLNRYIIDLSYVSKGAYTLRITYDNSEIKKVIKSDEGE